MISKDVLLLAFGISERTLYRVLKKLNMEMKASFTHEEVARIAENVNTVKIIYYDKPSGNIVIKSKTGELTLSQLEAIQKAIETKDIDNLSVPTSLIKVIENFTTSMNNFSKQLNTLTETIIELARKIERMESEKRYRDEKVISSIVNEYIQYHNRTHEDWNDVFLDLLGRFEKEKNISIRKQYRAMDRWYGRTIARLGLTDEFVRFIQEKMQ